MRVEVLGFADCPNTAEFRERVELAAKAAGDIVVVYVDQESLPATDLRRGYPAPTALLAGRDLFGLPTPSAPSMGCRMYPEGLPSVEATTRRIEFARTP
jgi:hypothetical protein